MAGRTFGAPASPGCGRHYERAKRGQVLCDAREGGQFGEARLLSQERVRSFSIPRHKPDEVDRVLERVLNLGSGGFHPGRSIASGPAGDRQ